MSGAVTPLHLTHEEAIAVLNWHLAYERAMREVVEVALVYEHEMHIMHDDALRVAQGLIESEGQALAAAREEIERMKRRIALMTVDLSPSRWIPTTEAPE